MWRKSKPYLLLMPSILIICILFFGGLLIGILQSFGMDPVIGENHFSMGTYERLFSNSDFWVSMWLSLRIAFLSSIFAGLFGLVVSICLFLISRAGGGIRQNVWQRLFQLPLIVPHIVAAYLMVLLFARSGLFSKLLAQVGLIHHIKDFPILVNDAFGWGIIFTYMWKEAPFIALMIYPVLLRVHQSWFEAAQIFGAGRWKFTKEIVIPILFPAWLSSTFIVFAFSLSAFEVPLILGITYPKMLSVYAYNLFSNGQLSDRPEAMAVNVILAVITALLGITAYFISKRWQFNEGRRWL